MQKEKQQTKWGDLNYFNKFHTKNYVLTSLLLVALFIILYFSFDPTDMFSYTAGIYINILIYILLAVSLNITVGLMGQLSLGHAGFIAVGAYTGAVLSKALLPYNLPPILQLGLILLFSVC